MIEAEIYQIDNTHTLGCAGLTKIVPEFINSIQFLKFSHFHKTKEIHKYLLINQSIWRYFLNLTNLSIRLKHIQFIGKYRLHNQLATFENIQTSIDEFFTYLTKTGLLVIIEFLQRA